MFVGKWKNTTTITTIATMATITTTTTTKKKKKKKKVTQKTWQETSIKHLLILQKNLDNCLKMMPLLMLKISEAKEGISRTSGVEKVKKKKKERKKETIKRKDKRENK